MRILFCGGGTAGHVNPALAIAQTVIRNSPNSVIAYVVTKNGIENSLVPYKKYTIEVKGLKRKFSLSNLKTIYLSINAIKESKKIIEDFCPDIVIGTGGYACFPVIYAAHKLGIKTALHESNVMPGKAVTMLQNKADIIFVNFEETKKYLNNKCKIVHSGNPLRMGFQNIDKTEARRILGVKEKYVILCYGGSIGATRVNDGAIQLIENYLSEEPDVLLYWATGKREYEKTVEKLKSNKLDKTKNVILFDYIYDMPERVAAADIVICRAGAMSVSEMASCAKCTVFIPSPNVTDNHQYKNAKVLSDTDSAVLIKEEELYKLTDTVRELIENDDKRKYIGENIRQYSIDDSNKIIYKSICELISLKY